MGMVPITTMGFRCEKCRHEWIPLDISVEPEECVSCHSTSWNKASGPMLTYDDFRNRIAATLRKQSPLTWTEIRTLAGLPQKFPNNTWVHRMEGDIGLERKKDSHGILNWQLRAMETDAAA